MNKNVIINRSERIADAMEDFRLSSLEAQKNYTASSIRLARQAGTDKPLLFYTQELTRNFKDPADPFRQQQIIRVFTPSNFTAVSDSTLEKKFKDTLLAHKPQIETYNPLSDIHSQEMNLFIDEPTAQFIEDIGISISGLSEDFASLESVPATPFMDDVAKGAAELKKELRAVNARLLLLREEMVTHFDQHLDPAKVSDDVFSAALAVESLPSAYIQSYLSLKEQKDMLVSKLSQISSLIFQETRSRITLPSTLENVYEDISAGSALLPDLSESTQAQ